jgi:hypothetical protein
MPLLLANRPEKTIGPSIVRGGVSVGGVGTALGITVERDRISGKMQAAAACSFSLRKITWSLRERTYLCAARQKAASAESFNSKCTSEWAV